MIKKFLIIIALITFNLSNSLAQFSNKTPQEIVSEAISLSNQEKYKESNDRYFYLVDKNISKDMAYYNIALNFYKAKDYKYALKYSKLCREISKEYYYQSSIIMGKCLSEQKQYEQEQEIYNQLIEKYPDDFFPLYCLAYSFYNQQNLDKALEVLFKALKLKVIEAQIHALIADIYLKKEYYAHSLLAMYFELLCQDNYASKVFCINKINKILNIPDIDVTIAKMQSEFDTIEKFDSQMLSAMLFIKFDKQCNVDNNTLLPELKCFVDHSNYFLENIAQYNLEKNNDLYNSYVEFYELLYQKNYLKEFLYYLTSVYKDDDFAHIFNSVSKDSMMQFADFLEEFLMSK